jgi:hypothetical protein
MVVQVDSAGRFDPFVPLVQGGDGFEIRGFEGYMAVV